MTAESLFREFLSGRRSFAALSTELATLAAGTSGLAEVEAVMADLVNGGRLPQDLAQILRAALGPVARQAKAEPEAAADWIDAPTETRPAGAPAVSMPMPGAARRAAGVRATTSGDLPVPVGEPLQVQMDDVLLSSLTGSFKTYRRARGKPEAGGGKVGGAQDRLLDSALESFRGARLRRDAVKASEGTGRAFDLMAEAASNRNRTVTVGSLLKDRFILDREIGRGGMGIVYRAVDRRRLEASHQQPYVAVKLLSGDVRRSPEAFRALEAEARRVQDLAHPNIVTIFDFDRDGGHLFIVMELLTGRPLDAVLREAGPAGLGFAASRTLVEDTCRGLAYAHGRGVIHCDLKPANLFVLETECVKLLDFGLAMASRGGKLEASALDGYTLAYASPEILNGEPRHPADDVYALGCLVYEIVAGRHPFDRSSALDARERRLAPARPSHLPGPAWAALRKALSFERGSRLQDAAAFSKAYFAKGFWGRFGR